MEKTEFSIYTKWIFILLTIVNLQACEIEWGDDRPRHPGEATDMLCYKIWSDTFRNNQGFTVTQELRFWADGYREETLRTVYPDRTQIETFPFEWRWNSYYYDALIWLYRNGAETYFDQLRLDFSTLSGRFGPDFVTFYNMGRF